MAPDPKLTLTPTPDGESILVAEGEIDASTSTALVEALSALPSHSDVIVDLAGITFVDSSGLRALVATHRRQREAGRELIIRSPSAAVRRLLDITGLTEELRLA